MRPRLLVIRSRSLVMRPRLLVIRSRSLVMRPRPLVMRSRPLVIRPHPLVMRPRPLVIRSRPLVMRPRLLVIRPRPLIIRPRPSYHLSIRGYITYCELNSGHTGVHHRAFRTHNTTQDDKLDESRLTNPFNCNSILLTAGIGGLLKGNQYIWLIGRIYTR